MEKEIGKVTIIETDDGDFVPIKSTSSCLADTISIIVIMYIIQITIAKNTQNCEVSFKEMALESLNTRVSTRRNKVR